MGMMHNQIRLIRADSGFSQAQLAEKMGISASTLSRMENGEINATNKDIQKLFEITGSNTAREYLEYLRCDWGDESPISFYHPDWRLLHEAYKTIEIIWTTRPDLNPNSIFSKRIVNYKEEIEQLIEYIKDTRHTVAFIGSIGVGKTTAICNIIDLCFSEENIPEKRPVLEVGGGRTTVCEVIIRSGGSYSLFIEPVSDESIRKEVQDFAEFILYSKGIIEKEGENIPLEDLSISREVERAIRNMSGLIKSRNKNDSGRTIVEDPILELAQYLTDPRELSIEILTRMNLPRRDRQIITCPEDKISEPLKWIKSVFGDINNGCNPDFSLPKRINITLPEKILRNIFNDNTENLYDLCFIDTKGIDKIAERADIERHFYDNRTIIVLCSTFYDAPEVPIQVLLKRAIEARASDIEKKSVVLVLPKANEALSVKDEMRVFAETDDVGYELQGEHVSSSLDSLGLSGLPCVFYNAHKEEPKSFRKRVIDSIGGIRDIQKQRLSLLLQKTKNMIDDQESEERLKVLSSVSKQIKTCIAQGRILHNSILVHVHDDLLTAIGRSPASTVRATIRRKGDWHNLDYSHHLSYGARTLLARRIDCNVNEMNAVLKNLMNTEDFILASDFLEQILDMINYRVQKMLSDAQVVGATIFQDFLIEADDDLWRPCLDGWGKGRGFRDDAKIINTKWFDNIENDEHITRTLSDFFEEKWNDLLNEIDDLTDAALKPVSFSDDSDKYRLANVVSIEDSITHGEDYCKQFDADIVRSLDNEVLCERLDMVLNTLIKDEKEILCLRYGINKEKRQYSIEEITEILNMSARRVRKVEIDAMRKMRHPTRAHCLRQFWGLTSADSGTIQLIREVIDE